MLTRCYNQKYHRFDRYGGRGIVVCDRWRESFESFTSSLIYEGDDAHAGKSTNKKFSLLSNVFLLFLKRTVFSGRQHRIAEVG